MIQAHWPFLRFLLAWKGVSDTNWSATIPTDLAALGSEVKKFGEMSIAGITFKRFNQCWPMPAVR
jgi:hypothetical protein